MKTTVRRIARTLALLSFAPNLSALPPSEPDWLAPVRQDIEARAADDRFSGVVLVAHGDVVVLREARGFADVERRVPVTIDTRFNLGSMDKMFTAVAVAQLAEAGRLRFEDTVGQHLPDLPNRDLARVTIHQLLTHTGGVGNIFSPQYEARKDGLLRVTDYLALLASEPLRFEPGARFEYSNGGFVLLGAIVERVSGTSYDDYVRAHVFEPAGMHATGSFPKTAVPPGTATGFTRMPPGPEHAPPSGPASAAPATPRRPNLDALPGRGSPAGGGYSTAGDLLGFANALLDHRLLSRDSTERVLSGKVATPRGKYGYGFSERFAGERRVVGHNGGFPGVNAELQILPETRDVVIVLSNYDPPAASQVADRIVGGLTSSRR